MLLQKKVYVVILFQTELRLKKIKIDRFDHMCLLKKRIPMALSISLKALSHVPRHDISGAKIPVETKFDYITEAATK